MPPVAQASLKPELNSTTTHIHQIYIKAEPGVIWDHITSPEWNGKYGYRCTSHYELKPGGKFFINTWSLAEIAVKNFKDKSWSRIGELLFLTESKFLFHPARIETTSMIITDKGDREEKKGIDFIYSISELESMLNKTGFKLKEIYSIPGKKQFTVGEPRAYIVAEKL